MGNAKACSPCRYSAVTPSTRNSSSQIDSALAGTRTCIRGACIQATRSVIVVFCFLQIMICRRDYTRLHTRSTAVFPMTITSRSHDAWLAPSLANGRSSRQAYRLLRNAHSNLPCQWLRMTIPHVSPSLCRRKRVFCPFIPPAQQSTVRTTAAKPSLPNRAASATQL